MHLKPDASASIVFGGRCTNGQADECVHFVSGTPYRSEYCPPLAPSYNETTAQLCFYENLVPDEVLGFKEDLTLLPGCVRRPTKFYRDLHTPCPLAHQRLVNLLIRLWSYAESALG